MKEYKVFKTIVNVGSAGAQWLGYNSDSPSFIMTNVYGARPARCAEPWIGFDQSLNPLFAMAKQRHAPGWDPQSKMEPWPHESQGSI